MNLRSRLRLLGTAVVVSSFVASAGARAGPGACPSDSKLLNGGPTMIDGDGPGTWWGLVTDGMVAAGIVDEDDQLDYLNRIFGTTFATLDDARTFNLQLVRDTWDANGNGFVCAFELRGTRAHFDNPLLDLTFFGVADDRIAKK